MIQIDHVYEDCTTSEEEQAYFAGFISRKITNFTNCTECLKIINCSLEGKIIDRNKAIQCISHGNLLFSSNSLYKLSEVLEINLLKVIGRRLHHDTMFKVLKRVSANGIPTIGCETHKYELTTKVIDYYLICRAQ